MDKEQIKGIIKELNKMYLDCCGKGCTYIAKDIRNEIEVWDKKLKKLK